MAGTVRLRSIEVPLTGNSRSFNRAAKSAANSARRLQRRQWALRQEMRRATAAAKGYARSLLSLRSAVALLAGSAGLGAILQQASQYAGVFLRTAEGAGILTENLLALRRVAGENFVSTELFDSSLLKLNQRISEAVAGQKQAIEGFEALGVSVFDAEGNLKSADRVLLDFIRGLADAGQEAVARARFVFEETSSQIVPALVLAARHGDNLANAYRRATDPTREMFEESRKLGVQFNDLQEDIKNIGVRIASDVSGPWTDLLQIIRDSLPDAAKTISSILNNQVNPALTYFVQNTKEVVTTGGALLLTFSRIGKTLTTLGAGIFAFIKVGGALASMKAGFTALLVPLAKVAALFTVISTGIQAILDPRNTLENVKEFFAAIYGFISDVIDNMFRIIPNLINRMLAYLVRQLQKVFNALPEWLVGRTDFGALAEWLDSAQLPLNNLGESLDKVTSAWWNMVSGADASGTAVNNTAASVKAITTDLDVFSESARRAAQARAQGAGITPARPSPEDNRRRLLGFQFATNEATARAASEAAAVADEQRQAKAFDDLQKKMMRNQQTLELLSGGFQNFFQSITDGTAKASDAFKVLAADIIKAVTQALVIKPLADSITGGIGSFFNLPTPAGAAQGGNVNAGQPRFVGELGTELFIPETGGRIVPNGDLMGGQSFVWNVNINSTDGPGVRKALAEARPLLQQDAVEAVAQAARRPGGLRG